jgi:hypothetical protein
MSRTILPPPNTTFPSGPSTPAASTAFLSGTASGTGICPSQNPDFLDFCLQLTYVYYDAFLTLARQVIPDQETVTVERTGILGNKYYVTEQRNIPSRYSIDAITSCLDQAALDKLMHKLLPTIAMIWFSNSTLGINSFPCRKQIRSNDSLMSVDFAIDGLSQRGCTAMLGNLTQMAAICFKKQSQERSEALWSLMVLIVLGYPMAAAVYATYQTCKEDKQGKGFFRHLKDGLLFPCELVAGCASRSGNRPY